MEDKYQCILCGATRASLRTASAHQEVFGPDHHFTRYSESVPRLVEQVDHPAHYAEGRRFEPIDVIEDWGLGMHLGTCVKYIARAGRKDDEIQDLEKARWYLDRRIQKLKEARDAS